MPRIKAASVAAHVAEQQAALEVAAIRLFLARGYDNVTLADIAAEMGLARNSLYRYVPDKAHILLRWFEQVMPEQVARAQAALGRPGDPADRILAWMHEQMEYAARPEHALVAQIATLVPTLDEQSRERLETAHEQLGRPLRVVVEAAGVPAPDIDLVTGLIQGLTLAAARSVPPGTGPDPDRYLAAAVRALLPPSAAPGASRPGAAADPEDGPHG